MCVLNTVKKEVPIINLIEFTIYLTANNVHNKTYHHYLQCTWSLVIGGHYAHSHWSTSNINRCCICWVAKLTADPQNQKHKLALQCNSLLLTRVLKADTNCRSTESELLIGSTMQQFVSDMGSHGVLHNCWICGPDEWDH